MTGTLFRIYNDYFVNVVIVKAMRVLLKTRDLECLICS